MSATTRTSARLFDDILTEILAADRLPEALGTQATAGPRWRDFDDREAYQEQLHLDLAAAGLPGTDW